MNQFDVVCKVVLKFVVFQFCCICVVLSITFGCVIEDILLQTWWNHWWSTKKYHCCHNNNCSQSSLISPSKSLYCIIIIMFIWAWTEVVIASWNIKIVKSIEIWTQTINISVRQYLSLKKSNGWINNNILNTWGKIMRQNEQKRKAIVHVNHNKWKKTQKTQHIFEQNMPRKKSCQIVNFYDK